MRTARAYGPKSRPAGKFFAWLLGAIVSMMTLILPVRAATFIVTSTADSGAGTLRAAITSANSTAGADTITFSLGGCPCVITLASAFPTITEALTITGPGQGNLAISGNNLYRVISSAAVPVTITDVTLQAGNAGAGNGGAILQGAAALTLTNVMVKNSTAASGGGVYASGTAAVSNSTIQSNTASSGSGGGIYSVGNLTLTGATLSSNTADSYGGGVLAAASVTATNSAFTSNAATQYDGGGMYVSGAATISGSTFVSNKTGTSKGYGGGGGMIGFGQTTITDTTFLGNVSADWGGGAYLAYFANTVPTALTNVVFTANTAKSGGGGGAFMWFDSKLTGVTFNGNSASYRGGGLYAGYSGSYSVDVSGGTFAGNTAPGGGGLYSDSNVSVDGTLFDYNATTNGNGGAIWTVQSSTVSNATITNNSAVGGNSGGIDSAMNLVLTNSTLTGNRTYTGSGGGAGAGGNATVTNSTFTSNTASNLGGGLIAYGNATVTGGNFTGNVAQGNWGGGVFANLNTIIDGTSFIQNTSIYAGGGLGVQSGTVQVTGATFQGNQSNSGGWGGGIYSGGPSLTISGSQFLSNVGGGPGGAVVGNVTDISQTLFKQNQTTDVGGAIVAFSDLNLSQSLLIANQAATGGGLFQGGGTGTITNTLFARNHATTLNGEAMSLGPSGTTNVKHVTIGNGAVQAGGSAIYVTGGNVQLLNNIVSFHNIGAQQFGGTASADYNLFFMNGLNVFGVPTNTHVLTGDPVFVNVSIDDYHLGAGSAAIDVAPSVGVTVDIDGDTRPLGAAYDVGYDERPPTAQSITFGALSTRTFGDAPFPVSASASSGLPVTLTVGGNCTIAGNTVTITGAGSCSVFANQAGNGSYLAAPQVTQSFTVNKGSQSIVFGALAAKTFGDAPFTVSATGGGSGNAVAFSSTTTGVCTVSGNTVTLVATGTCTIAANQAGNANYNLAPQVTQSFAVGKGSQSIIFGALANGTLGDAPFTVSATGGASGNPVTFSSTTTGVCTVSGNTVTLVAVGTCTIAADQAGNANYNAATQVTQSFSVAPGTNIPRLSNISTRMQVLTGNDVLIGGFVIGGSTPKTVVVRARGPSLVPFGITNALANPRVDLFSGSTVIASNDDWQSAVNAAAITSSGFAPSDPAEAAILTTLNPGAYTAIVSGVGNTTGVGIVEVFEVDHPEVPLTNISTRGQVLTGNDVMIGGFVIQGDNPQTVIVRARGPSLVPFGITNALANPVLQLFSGATQIATNDDWQTAANASQIQSSGFAPSSALESAILITLPPGAYTAIVTGAGGGTGVGIVEVFAQ